MIELAPYYYFIYWLVVMMLTIYYFSETYNYANYNVLFKRFDNKPLVVFSVFFVIIYGLRPISGYYFGDTSGCKCIFRYCDFSIYSADVLWMLEIRLASWGDIDDGMHGGILILLICNKWNS